MAQLIKQLLQKLTDPAAVSEADLIKQMEKHLSLIKQIEVHLSLIKQMAMLLEIRLIKRTDDRAAWQLDQDECQPGQISKHLQDDQAAGSEADESTKSKALPAKKHGMYSSKTALQKTKVDEWLGVVSLSLN